MNLILQAPELTREKIEPICILSGATKAREIRAGAFALEVSKIDPEVATACRQMQIDCAYIDQDKRLTDFGLLVMDMDSTLINIECIDEIADMQGIKPQVAEITASAMRGEIDFAESLKRRVSLLAGLDESALGRVYDERLQPNPGAEFMLATLKNHGIKTLLVSGGFTFFTQKLQARLGLDYTAANTLEIIDGKLTGRVLGTIVDAQGKADWLNKIRSELGLTREQVIAMGDGANDLKMMREAAIGIAYHAKPVVQEQASYAFNHAGLEGLINLFGA